MSFQHMNSPYNNIYKSLLRKFYCCLLLVGTSFNVFGQDEKIDPNGYNVFYFDDGRKASEGFFKNGLPEGVWKSYYRSGNLKSIGKKLSGESDSLWKFFNPIGMLTWTYEYANDMKNGCATKFDSLGKVAQESFYVDDKKQGEEQWFFPNGKLKRTTNFVDDKESGMAVEYNEDGIIIVEEDYSNGYLRKREEFNRHDDEGNKTGTWRTYFKNGNIATEIGYDQGKKEGTAKEYDKEGKLITINTMKGDSITSDPGAIVLIDLYKEYHQNGKVKLLGGLNKGMKSGIFREYDDQGKEIQGYIFSKDTLVSQGKIQAGGIFEGEWITYYKTGKIKSSGPYKNGMKDGDWVYYYPNGEKEQEGRFREDVLTGKWVWYYSKEKVKREEFYNSKGLLEGTVTEYDSLGNELARGDYYRGRREGAWFYHVGDYKEVGAFTLGLPDGMWQYFYKNGKVAFTGEFAEGEPKGKHTYFHKNGLRKKFGKYAGGEKHGIWREFNNRGEQVESIQYKRGEVYKINGFRVNSIESEE